MISNGALVGIVSWGHSCGDPNYPGVYTSVSKVLEFIRNEIEYIDYR